MIYVFFIGLNSSSKESSGGFKRTTTNAWNPDQQRQFTNDNTPTYQDIRTIEDNNASSNDNNHSFGDNNGSDVNFNGHRSTGFGGYEKSPTKGFQRTSPAKRFQNEPVIVNFPSGKVTKFIGLSIII